MNDQVCTAFMDFLAAECASNPVLLVLEDLHWGDSPTVEMLGKALRDMTKSPLFVLALARPEVHEMFPKLWAVRSMQEIRMLELSKKAAERLVRHVLGDRVPAQTIQKIVELSAGNAFYLEELIRATAEGHGDNLPETVVAMVQSRLGTLSDPERRILRAASIYGELFWTGAVAALLGDANTLARKVEETLRTLVDKELFLKRAESHFPNETEYAFRHALLREGAYSLLTDEDRALGHRLAGEWLERMGENDPVVLAEHFEKGGDGAKAGVQWALAAEQASRGNDAERGIGYAHRGLACTVPGETRNRLLGMLCYLHYSHIDTLDRARPHAEELLQACEPGSSAWAHAMAITLFLAARDGEAGTLARTLKEALTTEMKPEAAEAAAVLLGTASAFLAQSGNIPQANAMYYKLRSLADAAAEHSPTTTTFYGVYSGVRCAYVDQNPWAGLEHARAAIQRNLTIGYKTYALLARVYEALNWWYLGSSAAAKSSLLELHAFQGPGAASSVRPFALAWLLADSGSFTEARECAADFVARSRTRSIPLDEARGRWVLAEVLRRDGEVDSADTEIQIALSILRKVCPIDVPGALATQAWLGLARGRPEDALTAAAEGMAKMEAMGACSIFFRNAFLRLVHAESLNACGRHDDAKVAITKAREWLVEVAAKIGEDEYKKSFLENVPENRRILELARQWGVA